MVVRIQREVLHCESECNRGAGCGNSARLDLCGDGQVTGRSTMTATFKFHEKFIELWIKLKLFLYYRFW
ncbi:MAG: hypothetical protein ACJAUP_000539 [Cellvibrionaceae bacterium]|jgi:hypothetical protein